MTALQAPRASLSCQPPEQEEASRAARPVAGLSGRMAPAGPARLTGEWERSTEGMRLGLAGGLRAARFPLAEGPGGSPAPGIPDGSKPGQPVPFSSHLP